MAFERLRRAISGKWSDAQKEAWLREHPSSGRRPNIPPWVPDRVVVQLPNAPASEMRLAQRRTPEDQSQLDDAYRAVKDEVLGGETPPAPNTVYEARRTPPASGYKPRHAR